MIAEFPQLPCTWVNGVEQENVPANDRGLSYGDGLFETVAVVAGRPLLLEQHLARLERGLQSLKFPSETLSQVKRDLAALVLPETAVLKITVTRGVGQRGYALPMLTAATRILTITAAPDFTGRQAEGVKLHHCEYRLPHNPVLAQIKHLNRLDQVMARSEWSDPSIAEGIVCDVEGYVVEGTMSNILWFKEGIAYTPLLDKCGVRGVMLDYLLYHLQQLKIEVKQGRYLTDELLSADEVLVCNSLIGIWPVVAISDAQFSIGTMTRQLQDVLKKELQL